MKHMPALLVSVIALILGTTGGAIAATKITGRQIADSSITGKDVRNRSLTPTDFSGSVRGPEGPRGLQGPAGPSAVGQLTVVQSGQVPYGASVVQSAIAFCPAGQRVVSGGGINVGDEQLAATEPTGGRSGWAVIGVDLTADGGEYVQAYAVCGPAGQAVAAKVSRASIREHVEELEAQITEARR